MPHKRGIAAYVANVAALERIRHVVQVQGGGQPTVNWLASQQLSVATVVQLQVAGLGRGAIEHRVERGLLHRRHRGVYLVGSPVPPPGAIELAAVLACGEGAVVSHRSAAGLWGLLPPHGEPVDVTVVRGHRRAREGIRVFTVGRIDRRDIDRSHGIPVTAPARTLIDIAADATDGEFEQAVSEARALRLLRDGDLEAALARAGHRRGTAKVRAFLRSERESGFTRSEAERRMRRLAREAGLPQPVCNERLLGYSVDFLWTEYGVVVEVDGYQFHGHRSAFERDRRRDQALIAAGYTVVRITWRQLRHEPLWVAAVVASALTARRPGGTCNRS